MKRALVCVICLVFLAGCFEKPVNPGEIAFVNGTPITLKQLQAAHDAIMLAGDSPSRDNAELQREYREVLSELIVQELVLQELARIDMSVTDEELAAEEAQIRADFSVVEFERMMLEDSINMDMWRGALYRNLAMRKFWNDVLRQKISISGQEVEEYYLTNQDKFMVPEAVHFLQVSGLVREQIVAASEQFRQLVLAPDAENFDLDDAIISLQTRFPALAVRESFMHVDRMAPEQLSGLYGLQPMQSSSIRELNGELFTVILLDREKARSMTRTETYALIEGILLEEKTQVQFNSWLEERLAKSSIKVSEHLLKKIEEEGIAP